ncbi:MAG: transporter substrate-binding domain-containing protein [Clostridia bacterium]|nr:transporter substrate-binding domain-containing protein [Clostridia bacterium]
MKKFLALLLAVIMVLSFAACGKKEEPKPADPTPAPAPAPAKVKFIQGIDAEYPPFSYMDDKGNYTGFDVEICKAACDLLGWEHEIFGVNWDNKLIQLDAKECDCIWAGMTILDSMKQAGYVLSAPYFDNTQVVLVKADSGIKTAADLKGKVVAVQLGTSGDALLEGDLADMKATFKELVKCDSFLKCFTELDGNGVDAVFVDAPVAQARMNEKSGYALFDEVFGEEQYGIAFRSSDKDMCAKMEGAVAELVKNGTYAKIAEKYADEISPNSLIFLAK